MRTPSNLLIVVIDRTITVSYISTNKMITDGLTKVWTNVDLLVVGTGYCSPCLTPTPYFDLKNYGFYSDVQVAELLEKETYWAFPTAQNSLYGKQLDEFFAYLSARGNLKSLNVRILTLGHKPDYFKWDETSGVTAFLRPFKYVRGLQNATIKFPNWRDPSTHEAEVQQFYQEDAHIVEKWMTSVHGDCQQHPDIICACKTCFPSLPGTQAGRRNAETNSSHEEHDSGGNTQLRINEVEAAKARLEAGEAVQDGANWWTTEFPIWGGDEWAHGPREYYIGLQNTPHKRQYKELCEEFGKIWAVEWWTEDGFGIGDDVPFHWSRPWTFGRAEIHFQHALQMRKIAEGVARKVSFSSVLFLLHGHRLRAYSLIHGSPADQWLLQEEGKEVQGLTELGWSSLLLFSLLLSWFKTGLSTTVSSRGKNGGSFIVIELDLGLQWEVWFVNYSPVNVLLLGLGSPKPVMLFPLSFRA
ncbi:uncharacterized protein J3D65DRAFT_661366 [Phyllosticta citribraziliensis]|uniref:Uncharacterized protein n=1 Tax=Phyllosticta citribraziliensis TaxID=989973 RepID=A0ABR1LCC2_9PEZI